MSATDVIADTSAKVILPPQLAFSILRIECGLERRQSYMVLDNSLGPSTDNHVARSRRLSVLKPRRERGQGSFDDGARGDWL